MDQKSIDEEEVEEYDFSYFCRKCKKSIPAHFPDNINCVRMIEVKKHNYEFECYGCQKE